jgi:4-hydroxybenzoate polyprenyltransferase/phosphoserine phosphatase
MLPMSVDLDGTLIRSDLLHEAVALLIRRNPLLLFALPFWWLKGEARLHFEVARRVTLNPAALPYVTGLLSWLREERSRGRSLWLCTASNERLAGLIASHLGLFDGVLASTEEVPSRGVFKVARLVERFGGRGFDHCGNDLLAWKHAHGAIVVNATRRLERRAARRTTVLRTFPRTVRRRWVLLAELRTSQWAKNTLLLMPLLAAHRADELGADVRAVQGVISFSLCASSVYVLNDLLDLEADRGHPSKRTRPLAAGNLPILQGLLLAPALLLASALAAIDLQPRFWMVLGTYYALTLAYSFVLKGLALIDTLALATMYTLRIIAGAAAVCVPLSFWMLLFSVLLFLSLAFVRRYAELESLRRQQRLRATGRGYHVEDLPVLQNLGTAAGYISVLVLALYVNSPDIQALYSQPKLIWTLCVLMLYWVSRIWLTAQRGQMDDDPVVFALQDPQSLTLCALAGMIVALAI